VWSRCVIVLVMFLFFGVLLVAGCPLPAGLSIAADYTWLPVLCLGSNVFPSRCVHDCDWVAFRLSFLVLVVKHGALIR